MTEKFECTMCKGSGEFRLYHPPYEGAASRFELMPCPWCGGAGFTEKKIDPMKALEATLREYKDPRDALQRSHEDGDADGMGGCRGVLVAIAFMIGIAVVVWLLTTPVSSLISE